MPFPGHDPDCFPDPGRQTELAMSEEALKCYLREKQGGGGDRGLALGRSEMPMIGSGGHAGP